MLITARGSIHEVKEQIRMETSL